MATTEAPNPTLASIASGAARSHREEDEGRRRKRMADVEPMKANERSNRLR